MKLTAVASAVLAGVLAAGVAHAQDADGASETTPATGEFSDEKVAAFAELSIKIELIRQKTNLEIERAANDVEGITLEEFQTITNMLPNNPTLKERIQQSAQAQLRAANEKAEGGE